jgi:hypothetical protein
MRQGLPMKLEYTTEPTETMHVISPLGTQYAIPIWRPVGERSAPVMVTVAPRRLFGPHRPNVRSIIVEYMKQHYEKNGFTVWDLSIALDLIEDTVKQALYRNKDVFDLHKKNVYLCHPISGFWRKVHVWKLKGDS